MAEKMKYTKEAYNLLVERLDWLKNTRRAEVVHDIEVARGFGDLSENAEYDEARTEQAKVEAEIKELDEKIRNAVIIEEKEIDSSVISIGSVVVIRYEEDDEEEKYVIVSSNEVDSDKNHISNLSPLGKYLSGHKAGDVVNVLVEGAKGVIINNYKVEIVSVDRAGKDD
ncbi:MAG: transcription elongation factor GreA [Clostridia bacterium]|nr:transcription elongation factor GreA [Clostridia bacterium]